MFIARTAFLKSVDKAALRALPRHVKLTLHLSDDKAVLEHGECLRAGYSSIHGDKNMLYALLDLLKYAPAPTVELSYGDTGLTLRSGTFKTQMMTWTPCTEHEPYRAERKVLIRVQYRHTLEGSDHTTLAWGKFAAARWSGYELTDKTAAELIFAFSRNEVARERGLGLILHSENGAQIVLSLTGYLGSDKKIAKLDGEGTARVAVKNAQSPLPTHNTLQHTSPLHPLRYVSY